MALFGRRKRAASVARDRLFALSTARVTLEVELGLKTAGGSAGKNPVYCVYGSKTSSFWPFVPTGDGQSRDNAEELELKAKLEKELPIEPDLTKWLALYDAPI